MGIDARHGNESPPPGALRAPLEGGCLCGAVRYRVRAVLFQGTVCHCLQCRRASGAPMVAWFSVRPAQFELLQGRVTHFRASDHARRSFCGHCGGALFFEEDGADEIEITTCSLDDPEAVAPQDHTFTRRQLGWVRLADGLPRFAQTRAEGDAVAPDAPAAAG